MSTIDRGQQDTGHNKTYVLKNKYFPLHCKKKPTKKPKDYATITFWILNFGTKWTFATLDMKEMLLCYKHYFKIPVAVTFDIFPVWAVDRKERWMWKKNLAGCWGLSAFIPVPS